jgi:cystathionine beta-lyase
MGVETTYYPPAIGAGIAGLMRANTRVVYVESPSSITFEVQDIPAIAEAAHAHGALVLADNSWATPLYCKALALGADVVIHAATKFIAGHSDAMVGAAVANEAAWPALYDTNRVLGQCAGPDDIYLALRGLRTLSIRMARNQETALRLARWFTERPEVARIFFPALPDDPGHALWKRDFSGAAGVFTVLFRPCPEKALHAMADGYEHFAIGASWGGFESLILPTPLETLRTAEPWTGEGMILRYYCGLEDADDLLADLEAGFDRLHATM